MKAPWRSSRWGKGRGEVRIIREAEGQFKHHRGISLRSDRLLDSLIAAKDASYPMNCQLSLEIQHFHPNSGHPDNQIHPQPRQTNDEARAEDNPSIASASGAHPSESESRVGHARKVG